jgi:hypothetical protein
MSKNPTLYVRPCNKNYFLFPFCLFLNFMTVNPVFIRERVGSNKWVMMGPMEHL